MFIFFESYYKGLVVIAHSIAELPLYSGMWYRFICTVFMLATAMAILPCLVGGLSPNQICESCTKGCPDVMVAIAQYIESALFYLKRYVL